MIVLYKLKRLRDISYAYCRLLAALIYVRLHKSIYKKRIWLISEKRDEARDNGYWLFRYIKENHPEINAFYVIRSSAPDKKKLNQWNDCIIEPDSFKHCVFFLAAENNVSSQNDGAHPFWQVLRRKDLIRWKKLANPKQKVSFLQHGVIQDEIPHDAFDYGTNPMDCFVVSAEREQQFIVDNYHFPLERVPNLGLCRFDNLYNNRFESEKAILVMPTWRRWLQTRQGTHGDKAIASFKQSEYFEAYRRLLTSEDLMTVLKENGFKLLFYPHYEMQKYLSAFTDMQNSVVSICCKDEYDVQDLLLRAKILLTDYSSVFFDFAYMDKPAVYYQFDLEKFNESHYGKGYFDYKQDGFGTVCRKEDEVIEAIKKLIEDRCINPSLYHDRAKAFFNRFDGLNCRRNFEYIKSLKRQE